MAGTVELAARLAALRERDTPTPLWLFLYIYSMTSRECSIGYHAGSKVLISYLTAGGTVPLDYQTEKYPEILNKNFIVPRLLSGYDSSELAKALAASSSNFSDRLAATALADRAIYFAMSKKVIQLLY